MFSEKQPIDYSVFRITQFNFRDKKRTDFFVLSLRKLAGIQGRLSPIMPRVSLPVLGEAIGFNTTIYQDLLAYHEHRLKLQKRIGFIIYLLTCITLILPLVVPLIIFSSQSFSFALFPLVAIVLLLLVSVMAGIAMRFSEFVTLRFFSDSMSVQILMYLIVDLARYQNPLTLSQKKQLLSRITLLVKTTRSFIYQYDLDTKPLDWAKKHFRQIELYIQERERWVVAPKDSTIENLRQDFYHLGLMYLSGNLGNFEYETETDKIDDVPTNKIKNFLVGIPRVAIGIFLPISGLLITAWRPDLVTNIIDLKVLTLICIGWLLLAIDVILKLGIVSSVIGIAKGIKELT